MVTGGAGFIGANLCRHLQRENDVERIVVIDDLSTGSLDNLRDVDVDMVIGSILDRDVLDGALAGATTLVHLAARGSVPRSLQEPLETHRVNVTGTVEVLEAARRHSVKHVVFASSSSVYGASADLPKRESMATAPLSPYAASKLAAEGFVLAYGHAFSMENLAFRFFNVFGPGQAAGHDYAAVVPAFVDAALHGRPLPVNGDGRQTRDFTYVGTVVSVIAEAISRRVAHRTPVNLALGSRVSLLELVDLLSSELGRPIDVEHRPARVGDVRDSQADGTVLRSLFPSVSAVDLREALARTIAWHRDGG